MNHELLLDNAACGSQHKPLLDNEILREAIVSNVIKPLESEITEALRQRDKLLEVMKKLHDDLQAYMKLPGVTIAGYGEYTLMIRDSFMAIAEIEGSKQ